jgi:hypothetical protein
VTLILFRVDVTSNVYQLAFNKRILIIVISTSSVNISQGSAFRENITLNEVYNRPEFSPRVRIFSKNM